MRLPGRLIGAIAALAAGPAYGQALPTRFNIDLLYVTSNDRALEEHVRQWAATLNEKLQISLVWDTSLGLNAQNRILVSPAPQPVSPSPAVIEQRWRNRGAIQIVSGHGKRLPQVSAFEGSIYLGGLHGSLPVAIPIKQDINGGSFDGSSNFILVVTLYALSVDAAVKPATRCKLLQRAAVFDASLPASVTSAPLVKSAIRSDLASRCARRPG